MLALLQVLPTTVGRQFTWGLPVLVGNRENTPEDVPWVGRSDRAYRNMMDFLPIFAILVLVAHMVAPGNGQVVLGAELFFWARLVYVPVYIIGITWARTLIWAVSIVGMVIILLQIL